LGIGEVVSLLSIEWGVSLSQSVEARRAELLWIAKTTLLDILTIRCLSLRREIVARIGEHDKQYLVDRSVQERVVNKVQVRHLGGDATHRRVFAR
jgi:hypothetical protein